MTGGPRQLLFLRHGETEWNAAGRTMGQANIGLNRRGIRQALAARAELRLHPISSVWVSPLRRCRQTARLVLGHPCPLPCTRQADLRERDWGPWQGAATGDRPAHAESPAGVESHGAFLARVSDALARIDDPDLPLLVAHSGVFRAILELWSGTASVDRVPNAHPILLVR